MRNVQGCKCNKHTVATQRSRLISGLSLSILQQCQILQLSAVVSLSMSRGRVAGVGSRRCRVALPLVVCAPLLDLSCVSCPIER